MTKLKPWYKLISPRKDLAEGKPLDASEFAVHLDQVRDGRANQDYQDPKRFFARTFLTKNLCKTASQVVRRLSGKKTETSAVFNMVTQFGGGKTHSLTLLYHLASQGPKAKELVGVQQILDQAKIKEIPQAATAVFVGTEFDSITGRGGDDGTPNRKTPWGEIAFQLSGETGFNVVAQHEQKMVSPSGEVIRKFLPKDRPSLILIDELLNYISRNRKSGLATQLYNFIQNLSEEARGNDNVVLVVSIPASELEMTAEDQSDYERFKKLLDRVGKAVIMSAESEISEIIRRRLFEWEAGEVSSDGKVLLNKEALFVCNTYTDWLKRHKSQIPSWFSIDHAKNTFEETYPFHPMVLSVFERKWQELPRFQQTRGVLRLLALWVSYAYQKGFKKSQKNPLIDLGSAPLEDSQFRSAVFEQLGETRLEGAVTTDICGKKDSHAIRLDEEAVETIKKATVHKKVATTIFFESNGGQTKNEATLPEIRLAVAGPQIEIGNTETALEALTDACYYLTPERSRYRFSVKENLNKRFADRRASVKSEEILNIVHDEVKKVFLAGEKMEKIFFPEKSGQIPDRAIITLVIMDPLQSIHEESKIREKIDLMTREYGKSGRTYKSALIWVVADSSTILREEARKLIAWEDIRSEGLKLDDSQQRQLDTNIKRAKKDLTESVWRSYKHVMLLGKDNMIQDVDMGLITSSSSDSITKLIISRLRQNGDVEKEISARYIVRHWPPAFTEWSTQALKDVFYASPQFPRLLNGDSIKQTIARGVSDGHIAYVGKTKQGYDPFLYKTGLSASDIEITEDMYVITADEAEKNIEPPKLTQLLVHPTQIEVKPGQKQRFSVEGLDQFGRKIPVADVKWNATGGTIEDGFFVAESSEGEYSISVETSNKKGQAKVIVAKESNSDEKKSVPEEEVPKKIKWSGEIPSQKWTNFYMKFLAKLVSEGNLKINVDIEAEQTDGITSQQIEEIKVALASLGLNEDITTE